MFYRSWYGCILVERVERFCRVSDWRRVFEEINEFEKQLTDFGTILVKFWLHVDRDEQLARFLVRQETPEKQWKITEEDWRNREKWDEYKAAVDDMLLRTSTDAAPWTVVEANCKRHARLKVLRTVVDAARPALST